MTPIRSSDHAECSLHCLIFGTTALCSAWTIRGSGPACCRRLTSAHAELSASHIISLRERVSIRETLSPLDEPSISLERKQDGDADRAGPPAAMRRTRRSPPRGDGAIASDPGPGSRTRPGCARRGLLGPGGSSDPGPLGPGVSDLRGACPRGYTRGMSRTRWQGRDRQRLRQLVTDSYGWTCTLCHRPIDPHATALRDRLSIDHVLPVSRGGSDSLENLRPTHHGCNSAKRDGRRLRRRATETAPGFFPAGPPGRDRKSVV